VLDKQGLALMILVFLPKVLLVPGLGQMVLRTIMKKVGAVIKHMEQQNQVNPPPIAKSYLTMGLLKTECIGYVQVVPEQHPFKYIAI
jgi:hypothetical protein